MVKRTTIVNWETSLYFKKQKKKLKEELLDKLVVTYFYIIKKSTITRKLNSTSY